MLVLSRKVGVMLVAEGVEKHIERGYLYFAMAFSLVVELLNMRLRKQGAPVQPHAPPDPVPDPRPDQGHSPGRGSTRG
jgi:predicted tellurium resistance membrane protein TerC